MALRTRPLLLPLGGPGRPTQPLRSDLLSLPNLHVVCPEKRHKVTHYLSPHAHSPTAPAEWAGCRKA